MEYVPSGRLGPWGVLPNNTWYWPGLVGARVHNPAGPERVSEEPASKPTGDDPDDDKDDPDKLGTVVSVVHVPWLGNRPPSASARTAGVPNCPKPATAPSCLEFSAACTAAFVAGLNLFHAAAYLNIAR